MASSYRILNADEALRIVLRRVRPVSAETVSLDAAAGRVLARGEDILAGSPLLKAGARIRPWETAVLAAQGFEQVEVFRRPAVAVLSTGDELAFRWLE